MTEKEFRLKFSQLIEHYQFIEGWLKYIYAKKTGKNYVEGLEEVDEFNMTRLVRTLKQLDSGANRTLSDEDYKKLEKICKRRNFWCHKSFFDMTFDWKTGGLKNQTDIDEMNKDIEDADQLRSYLFTKLNNK